MKERIQSGIRTLYLSVFRRPLPDKLSLYFHSARNCEPRLLELIEFLSERDYSFKGPGDFLSFPGKAVFLSFDDNYRSWLSTLPIFERCGARATFYVNSWPFRDKVAPVDMDRYLSLVQSDEPETLSTAELLELRAAGHTIGSHTHTHPILTALPRQIAEDEIRVSKLVLEDLLQAPVTHFSYPFGMRRQFSTALRNYCRSIGFATVANGIPCMQYARSRPDSLHRSVWFLDRPADWNLENIVIDGRLFHWLSGRSAMG